VQGLAQHRRAVRGAGPVVERAGEVVGQHLDGISDDHVLELTHTDRTRIFNLGYYTWVEQQGVAVESFDSRKEQSFWNGVAASVPAWDRLIGEFNAEVGLN